MNIICTFHIFTYGYVTNAVDCDIQVSEFELQSRFYVPFWTNTNEKGINQQFSI